MKRSVIFFFLCSFVVLSCTTNSNKSAQENRSSHLVPNPEGLKKDSFMLADNNLDCTFERILNDPSTPRLAKQLFANNAQYTEEPLAYFDSLQNADSEKSAFYFRVITNSFANADGAYAEGLGNLGKEFTENHTPAFAAFFDYKNCFTDKDLHTWAKIVLLEFEIIDDNIESNKGETPLIHLFAQQLIRNSKPYSDSQKFTIKKFAAYLDDEWSKFLLHIEK